jgi:hypothetical protein
MTNETHLNVVIWSDNIVASEKQGDQIGNNGTAAAMVFTG